MTAPPRIKILSKPNCHLCDEAKEVISRVVKGMQVLIDVINIENDSQLTEQYGHDIPVVFLNDRKIFKHRVDERKLRDLLNTL